MQFMLYVWSNCLVPGFEKLLKSLTHTGWVTSHGCQNAPQTDLKGHFCPKLWQFWMSCVTCLLSEVWVVFLSVFKLSLVVWLQFQLHHLRSDFYLWGNLAARRLLHSGNLPLWICASWCVGFTTVVLARPHWLVSVSSHCAWANKQVSPPGDDEVI